MSYKHFSKDERNELSILLKKGYSYRVIGDCLERNHSSISREINNNSVNGEYNPIKAEYKAKRKRLNSKYQGMKINNDYDLQNYVNLKMKEYWTPEQIAGRLKYENDKAKQISAPSIYKYLYSIYGQFLCQYLPSKRYRKKRRKGKKIKREIIKNRVFIDKRPDVINERKRIGDWEADTLGRIKTDTDVIAGLTERKSRYLLIRKVDGLKYVINEFNQMLNPYRNTVLSSITYDNGVEFTRYKDLKVDSYFCHPYSSWEKGSVENSFKRLRRFIPKKSSLDKYSYGDIEKFEKIMNNTPRKCLNYETPAEVLKEYLDNKLKN